MADFCDIKVNEELSYFRCLKQNSGALEPGLNIVVAKKSDLDQVWNDAVDRYLKKKAEESIANI